MGLFEKLFPRPQVMAQSGGQFFSLLDGYMPVFHSAGECVYESELVRAAIDARSRHASKLKVEFAGGAKPYLRRTLTKAPNTWQTWSQFLYRLNTILDVRNTAFIVPVLNEVGETIGVYPIAPQEWCLLEYKGNIYIKFKFYNNDTSAIELNKVGILTKYQLKSDFFGESNRALNPTMDLIAIQQQGIEEGVKSAASFRFMAQMNNYMNDDDLAKERTRFTEQNLNSGGGFLLWPNTYKDIKQIDSHPFVVDAEQMKLIKENVYEYYGVNEDVLQNKAYGDAWSSFYEGCVEVFAIQFSEVLTRMLFTSREQSEGNLVMATANRLQYMTNNDKLNMTAQLLDRGMMTLNEARDVWNMPPVEGGDVRIVRGEYYNANSKMTMIEGESANGAITDNATEV